MVSGRGEGDAAQEAMSADERDRLARTGERGLPQLDPEDRGVGGERDRDGRGRGEDGLDHHHHPLAPLLRARVVGAIGTGHVQDQGCGPVDLQLAGVEQAKPISHRQLADLVEGPTELLCRAVPVRRHDHQRRPLQALEGEPQLLHRQRWRPRPRRGLDRSGVGELENVGPAHLARTPSGRSHRRPRCSQPTRGRGVQLP